MDDNYVWVNELTKQFLERDYLEKGQSVDDRVTAIANRAEAILKKPGFAAAFKENMQKGWYSLSTPVWTNFGNERGMPISCFGSHVEDTMASILFTHGEIGMMSRFGGGTSSGWSDVRGRGSLIKNGKNGTTHGTTNFLAMFEQEMKSVSQGSTRRGSMAGYLRVDHPDIMEWLNFRTEGNDIQDLSYGVVIPDEWMESMIAGDADKRSIWARILEARINTGFPFIMFEGNANKFTVDAYKDKGKKIRHSNLCSEIMLPNGPDESFVCCLSSMNIFRFDEWKNTNAVEILVYFLDAVMSEFVEKTGSLEDPMERLFMSRTHNFAARNRAIGIGWIGYHSYLQSKMVAWESDAADMLNEHIAKTVHDQAYAASAKMVSEGYEEPEVLKGYGRRHATLLAIAPTKSSAFILGQVSEGIEPHRANFFIKDLAKGKFTIKNEQLIELLKAKGQNTDAVWDSIIRNAGSVQHLDFLSPLEKAVFKTFREISPAYIVSQAADRQKYIDQGQSLNLLINPKTSPKEINKLYIDGWKSGIKSFYYQISVNAAQEFSRELASCEACSA